MSDVIAAVRVNGELLVYIDYDRPVWQNAGVKALASTPSLTNFMVDGILGSVSLDGLKKFGILRNFTEEDFWSERAEIKAARQVIYDATDLAIEYLYYDERDPLIDGDLLNFKSQARIQKLGAEAFFELVKPVR